jgi:hypothetical protein
MGVLEAVASRVAAGAVAEFRPKGSSMVPLIRSRQLVTVAPVDVTRIEVGDIVLARVAGAVYLHLVSAVDPSAGRVQISNNRGRVNGWTSYAKVFGICTSVEGVHRARIEGKALVPSAGELPSPGVG